VQDRAARGDGNGAGRRRLGWRLGCETLSSGAKLLVLLPDRLPSQATVHRIPVRHGLLAGTPRRKPRQCQRGERDTAMRLWQTAIIGGVFVAFGRGEPVEAKVMIGVDDHARYCVVALGVPRAIGRAVYEVLLDAAGVLGDMAAGQAPADARVRQHDERPHQAGRWPSGVAGNDKLRP
jgi:hypothetical protein